MYMYRYMYMADIGRTWIAESAISPQRSGFMKNPTNVLTFVAC